MKIGYARVSSNQRDIELQIGRLCSLGADPAHIYLDEGFYGAISTSAGIRNALDTAEPGDEFVVPGLERLANNLTTALEIIREVGARDIVFNLGGDTFDLAQPGGRALLTILTAALGAETSWMKLRHGESALRAERRVAVTESPAHDTERDAEMLSMYEHDRIPVLEIVTRFSLSRYAVYRALNRARKARTVGEVGSGVPVSTPRLLSGTRGVRQVEDLMAGRNGDQIHKLG